MSTARTAAERYVDHVNARDLEALVALFADGAVVRHPLGEFAGIAKVREFYATNILPHAPALEARGWVSDDTTCAFLLDATTAGRTSHAIDHCVVDAGGRIVEMTIAYR